VQEQEENFSYEELALGYANRSAVLFQMKEYELCIRDITRQQQYLRLKAVEPSFIAITLKLSYFSDVAGPSTTVTPTI
jgi:hypothetical protein